MTDVTLHHKDKINTINMILVTGATGHLGSAAIDKLLKEGVSASQMVALVRDINKAENLKSKNINIRLGEYDNYASLQAATKDIDKILFISSSDMYNDRLVQHKNLIDAAVENNVKYIVYTGIDIRDYETTVIPHVTQIHKDTIAYLNSKNVPHTILGNTLYADVIPMPYVAEVYFIRKLFIISFILSTP